MEKEFDTNGLVREDALRFYKEFNIKGTVFKGTFRISRVFESDERGNETLLIDYYDFYDGSGHSVSDHRESVWVKPRWVRHDLKYDDGDHLVERHAVKGCIYESKLCKIEKWKYGDDNVLIGYKSSTAGGELICLKEYDSDGRITYEEVHAASEEYEGTAGCEKDSCVKRWWAYDASGKLLFFKEMRDSGEYETICYNDGKEFLRSYGNLYNDDVLKGGHGAGDLNHGDVCYRTVFDNKGRRKLEYNDSQGVFKGGIKYWKYSDNGACECYCYGNSYSEQYAYYDSNGKLRIHVTKYKSGSGRLESVSGRMAIDRTEFDCNGREIRDYHLCLNHESENRKYYDENGNIVCELHCWRDSDEQYKPAEGKEWSVCCGMLTENEYYPDGKTLKKKTEYIRALLKTSEYDFACAFQP